MKNMILHIAITTLLASMKKKSPIKNERFTYNTLKMFRFAFTRGGS